ncbi:MAG: hypothetical protein ABW199_09600, partial [Caulobacterales bacterium]
MAGIFFHIFAAAASLCAVTSAEHVELDTRDVRVRDVASLGCFENETRSELGDLVIARLPENNRQMTLSRTAIANLVRRRAPALSELAAGDGAITIGQRVSVAGAGALECFALAHPLPNGAAISMDDLEAAPCADHARGPLTYDRASGALRAGGDLAQGDYIGRV